jgi:hypothetical protein
MTEPTKGKAAKKAPRPAPARHRRVRQWMIAKGDALCRLVGATLADVDRFKQAHHLRVRARRPADRESREDLVHALVVNLAHASLCPPPRTGRLAVRAGNSAKGVGRYDNAAFGKGVRPLLDQMHEMGLLDFRLPLAMRGEVSSIAPTPEFASRVRDLGITLADFGRDEREEVLVLTRRPARGCKEHRPHQLRGDRRDQGAQRRRTQSQCVPRHGRHPVH